MARAAPIAHTLDQLTSGSARYELALRLARGLIALALSYALAIAAAVSGDTSTNHARRAKSIERRAAAKNTGGAC